MEAARAELDASIQEKQKALMVDLSERIEHIAERRRVEVQDVLSEIANHYNFIVAPKVIPKAKKAGGTGRAPVKPAMIEKLRAAGVSANTQMTIKDLEGLIADHNL